MKEKLQLSTYIRKGEILKESVLLATIVIASCSILICTTNNKRIAKEQKEAGEIALIEHKNKVELQKTTEKYREFKNELDELIAKAETTKKVVTPTTATYAKKETESNKKNNDNNSNIYEVAVPTLAVNSEESHAPTEYKSVLEVKATAYCLCKKCCGKSEDHPQYGVTRSGLKIIPGTGMKVIAVDPKVIPLGSRVYVEGLNGVADYGYAVAADTGGAIKNNKIDLYMDSHKDTLKWGVKNVRVYVIE